jgi:HAE1 family hydrophobic/amphiphilic exporter-1
MTQFCVDRPVFTAMLFAALVFLGGLNWGGLPVNLFPEINQPSLSVVTKLADASPEEVEAQVTRPLEEELCVVKQLRRIYSVSSNGVSTIVLDFDWATKMDAAGLDVREKIDRARRKLPYGVEEPQIEKYSPASWPVLVAHFSSRAGAAAGAQALYARVQGQVKPVLERAKGVALARLSGGAETEILVSVDRARLGARRLSADDVAAALARENVSERGGVISEGGRDLVIRTVGEFKGAAEIAEIVVRSSPEGTVRLRDVASVAEAPKARESYARLDGSESIQLSVYKAADGNTVQVCEDVKAALEGLRAQYPELEFKVTFDQSVHIGKALDMLKGNALGGALLCSLTLFFFLGRISSTSIAIFAMPLSIVPLSMLFKAFGVSLNIFSLTGIALGLGMVVDNAAIILENVGRHVNEGRLVREAAVSATTELSGAMVASTMTVLAVFIPVLLVPGLVAQLFSSISYAISFSMAISLFISFTIVPMLAARQRLPQPGALPAETGRPGFLARLVAARNRLYGATFKTRLLPAYVRLLKKTISNPSVGLAWLGGCALLFALGLAALPELEFLPKGRTDSFYANLDLPPDASLEETDRVAAQVEKLAAGLDGVKTCASEISQAQAKVLVVLKAASYADPAMARLRGELAQIPSLNFSLEKISPIPNIGLGSGRGSDLAVKIIGEDQRKLAAYSGEVKAALASMKEVQGVKAAMEERVPGILVRIDPQRAARYGLTAEAAAADLKTALSGRVATRLRLESGDQDIRVAGGAADSVTADQVGELAVWSPVAGNIKVKDFATLERSLTPVRMEREERRRITTVTAGLAPGATLGKALKKLSGGGGLLEKIKWEPGYSYAVGGASESMNDSFSEMYKALAIGLVLVYMVMAAQFESLFQPLIIMTSVPLGFLGALLGLRLVGAPLNIMGLLGILMLGGVTVGSAIIMIDYINILRARGTDLHEAIMEAGEATLSPILNTVGTTLADSVPLALALGAGSELYRDLGLTITAGLAVSTVLTLFVIPLLYCRVEEAADWARLLQMRLLARFGGAR